jgi:uncharacterized protein
LRQYKLVKEVILGKLRDELPAHLSYHNADHTNDVIQATEMLADGEGIDGLEKELLLTAAVFHDTGFLTRREEHEAISCEIAREILPKYGYEARDIDRICTLIMATRIPQSPKDKIAEVLCDADLDYLGRSDFLPLSQRLFRELQNEGLLQHLDEWNQQQADFVGNHDYFTKTAITLRSARQHEHVELIKSKITKTAINENP